MTKYGVVALAEVLHRELRPERDRGLGAVPYAGGDRHRSIRAQPAGPAGRYRRRLQGPTLASASRPRRPPVLHPDDRMAGRVLPVDEVAEQVVAAIGTDRLYIVPHAESREMIRRRFQRIDAKLSRT